MNKEKFLEEFKNNPRVYFAVRYAFDQTGWFDYNEYAVAITQDALERHKSKPKEHGYTGSPSASYGTIKHLITIGFLLVDPIRGLNVNNDFTPLNQR